MQWVKDDLDLHWGNRNGGGDKWADGVCVYTNVCWSEQDFLNTWMIGEREWSVAGRVMASPLMSMS